MTTIRNDRELIDGLGLNLADVSAFLGLSRQTLERNNIGLDIEAEKAPNDFFKLE